MIPISLSSLSLEILLLILREILPYSDVIYYKTT